MISRKQEPMLDERRNDRRLVSHTIVNSALLQNAAWCTNEWFVRRYVEHGKRIKQFVIIGDTRSRTRK